MSDTTNTHKKTMAVTAEQVRIIKAGIPLMKNAGDSFLKVFYDSMLGENPELYNYFNKSHQKSLAQPRALTHAVVAYAENIDKLQNIGPVAERIVNKHVSLMVKAEHYPIVGKYLLRTISEQFGPNVATPEFLDAWGAAYNQLADILIKAEEDLYKKNAEAVGGWRGYRPFEVVNKVKESPNVTSFYLRPQDGKKILPAKPGQYLGFHFKLGENYDCRQYSISELVESAADQYRVSVKKLENGKVSGNWHDNIHKGDVVEVTPPVGDFTLHSDSPARHQVFISAGVGITPCLSMADQALNKNQQTVTLVQCDHSEETLPFKEHFSNVASQHPSKFQHHKFFSSTGNRFGKADLAKLVEKSAPCDIYVIGPPAFMTDIKCDVKDIPGDFSVYYDFFGPQVFENDA